MVFDLHESRIKAFLAEAQLSDPERFAVVCARHAVKTERQMQRIRKREIPMGLNLNVNWSDRRRIAAATEASLLGLDEEIA